MPDILTVLGAVYMYYVHCICSILSAGDVHTMYIQCTCIYMYVYLEDTINLILKL